MDEHNSSNTSRHHASASDFTPHPSHVNAIRVGFFLLTMAVSLVGTGTNVVNLVVFWRQGFRESINVSLFSLAISDTVSLAAHFVGGLTTVDQEFAFLSLPVELWFLSGWITYSLSVNSCCTAVFISMERCLCVLLPFKVKDIITPRRAAIIIAAIFAMALVCVSPVLSIHKSLWKHDAHTNTTVSNTFFIKDQPLALIVTNGLLSALQTISFLCLLVTTISLTLTLRRNSQWRQKTLASTTSVRNPTHQNDGYSRSHSNSSNKNNRMVNVDNRNSSSSNTFSDNADNISNRHQRNSNQNNHIRNSRKDNTKNNHHKNVISARDQRVIKMVVAVSSILLVCYAPGQILTLASTFAPEFNHEREYSDLYRALWAVAYDLYAWNASVNFPIYLVMSSRFRDTFNSLVSCSSV